MKSKTTPTTYTDSKAFYNDAFKHTYKALNSINCKAYSPMLTRLLNNQYSDKKALNTPFYVVEHNNIISELEDLTDSTEETRKAIKRLSTSQAERDEHNERLTEELAELDSLRADRDNLTKFDGLNFSDFMDSVQEYALGTLEPITAKDYKKAVDRLKSFYAEMCTAESKAEHIKQLNPFTFPHFNAMYSAAVFICNAETRKTILLDLATYYHAKSKVTKHIHSSRAPQVYEGTHTNYYQATAEELTQWQSRHEDTEEVEEDKNGNKKSLVIKDGIPQFKVIRKTIKNGISFENFKNEDGEYYIDGYITSYHTLIDSLGEQERIQAIIDTINPTPRERNILKYYFTVPAESVENKAHIQYYNEHRATAETRRALKEFNKLCNTYATDERIKYAVKRETGLIKDDSIGKVWRRLKKHITEQIPNINAIISTPTAKPTDFDFFRSLMLTNRPLKQATAEPRADLIQWIMLAQQEPQPSVIQWTKPSRTAHSVTAEEKELDELTERERQATAKLYGFKLETFKALRDAEQWNDNGTYNAKYSAFTFFNSLSEDEQLTACKLRLDEQSQAKAKLSEIKKRAVTLEQWHNMSRAEKDKYISEFQAQYK